MRRALVILLALAVTAALAGAALASTSLPTLLGNSVNGRDKLLVRPAQIEYTGDGTGILGGFDGHPGKGFGHLKWTRWTKGSASGHGADWINDCMPDCADGSYSAHEASVSAFRPRNGHFTRLTVTTSYKGRRLISKLKLVKTGRVFIYTFA